MQLLFAIIIIIIIYYVDIIVCKDFKTIHPLSFFQEKLTLKKNGFEFVNLGGELEEILKKIQKQKNLDGFRGDLAYEFLFKVISL